MHDIPPKCAAVTGTGHLQLRDAALLPPLVRVAQYINWQPIPSAILIPLLAPPGGGLDPQPLSGPARPPTPAPLDPPVGTHHAASDDGRPPALVIDEAVSKRIGAA